MRKLPMCLVNLAGSSLQPPTIGMRQCARSGIWYNHWLNFSCFMVNSGHIYDYTPPHTPDSLLQELFHRIWAPPPGPQPPQNCNNNSFSFFCNSNPLPFAPVLHSILWIIHKIKVLSNSRERNWEQPIGFDGHSQGRKLLSCSQCEELGQRANLATDWLHDS